MRKILWVGDAACDSGFSRVTHNILANLGSDWDPTVLGLNYRGDPHSYPYDIYPCWAGGDMLGVGRLVKIIKKVQPEVVVFLNDVWNIPGYLAVIYQEFQDARPKCMAYVPVDGTNCRGYQLNGLDRVVFYTKFGQREAEQGGLIKPSGIVPHGVDPTMYYPVPRDKAREWLGLNLPADAFIVGNVGRNHPRKRWDLTIKYFALWVKLYKHDNAFLYLHSAPTGDVGVDTNQLAAYHGLQGRLILGEPEVFEGVDERAMRSIYSAMDVQVSTASEGWGLCQMEAMACEVANEVPDWAGLGEWPEGNVLKVRCSGTNIVPKVNAIHGVPDEDEFIAKLQMLYDSPNFRKQLGEAGRRHVLQEKFTWPSVGRAFAAELDKVFEDEPCPVGCV